MSEAFEKWCETRFPNGIEPKMKEEFRGCYEAATPQWQPIETAPKDGTRIIGYDPHPNIGVRECFWFEWKKEWIYMEDIRAASDWIGLTPTRWRPRPEPPNRKWNKKGKL